MSSPPLGTKSRPPEVRHLTQCRNCLAKCPPCQSLLMENGAQKSRPRPGCTMQAPVTVTGISPPPSERLCQPLPPHAARRPLPGSHQCLTGPRSPEGCVPLLINNSDRVLTGCFFCKLVPSSFLGHSSSSYWLGATLHIFWIVILCFYILQTFSPVVLPALTFLTRTSAKQKFISMWSGSGQVHQLLFLLCLWVL